jgi:hypothetical protein
MWIDSDDGNKVYAWTGAWTARQFGDSALASLDLNKLTVVGTANLNAAVAQEIAAKTAAFQKADIGNLTVTGTSTLGDLVAQALAAQTAQFLSVKANQISSGELNAAVALLGALTVGGTTGARLQLDPSNGFTLYSPDDSPLIRFPVDGSGNLFDGDIIARGLTTMGRASFRGVDNEISRDSAFVLASGTTRPSNSPFVSIVGSNSIAAGTQTTTTPTTMTADQTTAGAGGRWKRNGGACPTPDGTLIARVVVNDTASYAPSTKMRVEVLTVATGATTLSPELAMPAGFSYFPNGGIFDNPMQQVFKVGSEWWVLARFSPNYDGSGAAWRVIRYSAAWAKVGEFGWAPGLNEANTPSGSTDGTNFYIGVSYMGDYMNIRRYSSAGAVLETILTGQITSGGADPLALGPICGNYDYGSKRFFASTYGLFAASPVIYPINAAGSVQATEKFGDLAFGWSALSMAYWGGRVRSISWASPTTPTQTAASLSFTVLPTRNVAVTYYIGSTWYDSDPGGTGTHETDLSPITTMVLPARSGLSIWTAAPADAGDVDSPDSARIYVGTAANALHLVGANVSVASPLYLWDFPLTGAAPPAVNSFPNGVAGLIKSAIGDFVVKGDGTGDWPYLSTQILAQAGAANDALQADMQAYADQSELDAINTAATVAENKDVARAAAAVTMAENKDIARLAQAKAYADGQPYSYKTLVSPPATFPNNAWTKITGWGDNGGASGVTFASDRWTFPTAGRYLIMSRVSWARPGAESTVGGRGTGVRINGNSVGDFIANPSDMGVQVAVDNNLELRIEAGDYLELWGFQNTGATDTAPQAGAVFGGLTVRRVGS